jgi:hypothetical protein
MTRIAGRFARINPGAEPGSWYSACCRTCRARTAGPSSGHRPGSVADDDEEVDWPDRPKEYGTGTMPIGAGMIAGGAFWLFTGVVMVFGVLW